MPLLDDITLYIMLIMYLLHNIQCEWHFFIVLFFLYCCLCIPIQKCVQQFSLSTISDLHLVVYHCVTFL